MEKITFIKNLHFGKEGLYSIDEFGETTMVFVRQGNLESACVVYSLVMMLLLLNFIKVEDLKNPGCRDDDGFVAKLKKQYIDGLKALCKYGYKLPSFARRLAKIGDGIINVENGELSSDTICISPKPDNEKNDVNENRLPPNTKTDLPLS